MPEQKKMPQLPVPKVLPHNNIEHSFEPIEVATKDGDFNAVVVKIPDTGIAGEINTIAHDLGRVPIGCQIILKDAACDVYVDSSNENEINVIYTASRVGLNLRIW